MAELPTDYMRRQLEREQNKSIARDLGTKVLICYAVALIARRLGQKKGYY